MIFGSFRSFQNFEPKILKKIQVTLITSNNQTMHFFHGRPIHAVLQSLTPFSDLVDLADMAPFGAEKHVFRWYRQLGK